MILFLIIAQIILQGAINEAFIVLFFKLLLDLMQFDLQEHNSNVIPKGTL